MPIYTVMIEGILAADTPLEGLEGFFTHRVVRAPDAAAAERQALKMITDDWLANYVSHPRNLPQLRVTETSRSSLWSWLRASNRGHSFWGDVEDRK